MFAVEGVAGEGVGGEDAAGAGDGGGAEAARDRDRAFAGGAVAGERLELGGGEQGAGGV